MSEKWGQATFRKGKVACPLTPSNSHRRAGADEVAVAVGVVDAPDGRPELALAHPGGGVATFDEPFDDTFLDATAEPATRLQLRRMPGGALI
jgi:hypothetical protein